ncbi:MAG: hypothetical protein FJX31_07345 [Alphaproteobacteria bacterium]|nr:hypothetical protein [Alphaproteobacteria bacterium]
MIHITADLDHYHTTTCPRAAADIAQAWMTRSLYPIIDVVIGGGAAPLTFLRVEVTGDRTALVEAIRVAQAQEDGE